ncbi:MAG: type II toxin-antitoxin system RelE/ParE family toxin [Alphaproteobacteria bacterium]|nr:type II toxin-antitoxin system RelE/ParE family toxin [Alphaproteobacteria bacterium]
MKNLQFSQKASRDIDEIYLYGLINFGEDQADFYSEKMKKLMLETLRHNPEIGRLDTRVNPAVRRFEFESHVIFYDVTETEIIIVRILYGGMDFVKHL